jgi:uncharacterized membrane protein
MSNKTATNTPVAVTEDLAHSPELGHGNSPAAWTSVAVMLVGALVACVAFVLGPAATIAFIIGLVIMVLGLVAGLVMRAMGYGVGGSKLNNNGH